MVDRIFLVAKAKDEPMPTNTNTEVIDTTTPPQGLFEFQAGGSIEFVSLDSGPSLFEQPGALPWFPLPGERVGCLVWFNTATMEKGQVTFPMKLTTPGHYAVGVNVFGTFPLHAPGTGYDFRYTFVAAYTTVD